MKKLLFLLLIFMILIIFISGCAKDPSAHTESTADETIELAESLLRGRWAGQMTVETTEGAEGLYFTDGKYDLDLYLEFTEDPDRPGPHYRSFSGMAHMYYHKPAWRNAGADGLLSVDHQIHTPVIIVPVKGWISRVAAPEKYGEPAHMQFRDREIFKTMVTTTIKYRIDKKKIHTEVTTSSMGEVPYGVEMFYLRQLEWIYLTPVGDNRLELSPHSHLLNGIPGTPEDRIEGYLQRVEEKTLPNPLQPGDTLKTSAKEAIRARLTVLAKDVELLVEPNSEIRVPHDLTGYTVEEAMEITRGFIMSRVSGLGPDQLFRVLTPATHIAVRGTDFAIRVLDDGTTTVTVFEGTVELTCRETGETVTLKENQSATVVPGTGLLERQEISPLKLPWW